MGGGAYNKIILLRDHLVGEIKSSPLPPHLRLRPGMAFGQGLGWSANNLSLHRKRCQTFKGKGHYNRNKGGGYERDNRMEDCMSKKKKKRKPTFFFSSWENRFIKLTSRPFRRMNEIFEKGLLQEGMAIEG